MKYATPQQFGAQLERHSLHCGQVTESEEEMADVNTYASMHDPF